MKARLQQSLREFVRAVGALLRDIGYKVLISVIATVLMYKYPILDYIQSLNAGVL